MSYRRRVKPPRHRGLLDLNARQVNLLLEAMLIGAFATGLTSWAVGTGWNRWWTLSHALCGLTLLVLAPAKMRRSVRAGMRRGRWTKWLSVTFGVMVFTAAALGLAHSTGLWFGHGYWSPLWTHFLVALALLPLFVWHVRSRPVRARRVDLDRRLLLGAGTAVGVAAAVYGATEVAVRLTGRPGGRRRFTGSHEVSSFEPASMPTVSWIDDRSPATPREEWRLLIDRRPMSLDELAALAQPTVARLDCTGGWWSAQRWDAVPVAELLEDRSTRSFEVRSATGYARLLPMSDAEHVYLAVGYGGQPLRRGHGAPVRLVVPGRRGPWWVKWVTSIEPDDRPWWLQLPFPAT
jgi:hypothetical protein